MKTLLSLMLLAMTISFAAFAQDEVTKVQKPVIKRPDMPSIYSPDYCEFTAKFPEEPYKAEQCDADGKCFEQVSFTRVYELSSTVSLRVVCNPSEPNLYTEYTPAVMEAALKGMTRANYVKEINSSYREGDGYKQAGLVAEGVQGVTDKIYIAQLWIGRQSVMSIEAQMIGVPNDAGDVLFSTLLDNVGYTGVKKPAPESENKDDEKKSEEKPEEKKAE
jgi:hypothetical protein